MAVELVLKIGPVVAQVAEVCEDDGEIHRLCAWILERTGVEWLARGADVIAAATRVVGILAIAYVVSRLAARLVTRFSRSMEPRIEERLERAERRGAIGEAARYRTRRLQRLHAVTGVLRGLIAAVVWIAAFFIVLADLGVRLQPILAGAGLIGVIVGFGAQQLVRDVIAGIAMLIEDQYGVGDWIEVDGVVGEVERVGLRSTAFRDLDGVVHHVLNGYMQRVGNLSQHWARATYDVPVALDADVAVAKAIIHKVATDVARDPVWGADVIGEPEIWGVQDYGPNGVLVRVVIATKPLRNWDIKRQLRERIKFAFDRANIRMPSQLVDVGGQATGHPVATHRAVDADAPGVVAAPDAPEPAEDPGDDVDLPTRDHTDRLRLQHGPQPRPD
ncbi:MAG: mechanosensitive ion channel family protein [Nitriliruptoraceae bacterium]